MIYLFAILTPCDFLYFQAMESSVILVTGGFDSQIKFWEALTRLTSKTIPFPESHLNCLDISADKHFLVGCGNSVIKLFDTKSTTKPLVTLEHPGNVVSNYFFGPGLLSCSEQDLRLFDLRSNNTPKIIPHNEMLNHMVVHKNFVVAADQIGQIVMWDIRYEKPFHTLCPVEDVAMRSVSISPNGSSLFAVNNNGTLFKWDNGIFDESPPEDAIMINDSMTLSKSVQAHSKYILKCMMSPNGQALATCSADSTIKLWNPDDLSEIKTLKGHSRWVWDCRFSADSQYLVSVSSDHSARLWDINQGESIRQYTGHQKAVVCVALNDQA